MHQTQTCCNHSRNQQKTEGLHEELGELSTTTHIICKNLFLSHICQIFNKDEIISVLQSHKNLYFSILAIGRLRRHLQWANKKLTILGLFPCKHAQALVAYTHFSFCQNMIFSIGNVKQCQMLTFWHANCFLQHQQNIQKL